MTLKLRNQFLDRRIAELTNQASQPELPDAERIVLLREQQELRKRKQTKLFALSEV